MSQRIPERTDCKLVCFKCPQCGLTTTAFLAPGQPAMSICERITDGKDAEGMPNRCNTIRDVVLDTRDPDERGTGLLQEEADKRMRILRACQHAISQVRDDLGSTSDEIVIKMGMSLRGIGKRK